MRSRPQATKWKLIITNNHMFAFRILGRRTLFSKCVEYDFVPSLLSAEVGLLGTGYLVALTPIGICQVTSSKPWNDLTSNNKSHIKHQTVLNNHHRFICMACTCFKIVSHSCMQWLKFQSWLKPQTCTHATRLKPQK